MTFASQSDGKRCSRISILWTAASANLGRGSQYPIFTTLQNCSPLGEHDAVSELKAKASMDERVDDSPHGTDQHLRCRSALSTLVVL